MMPNFRPTKLILAEWVFCRICGQIAREAGRKSLERAIRHAQRMVTAAEAAGAEVSK
jgi:hypothetical protein